MARPIPPSPRLSPKGERSPNDASLRVQAPLPREGERTGEGAAEEDAITRARSLRRDGSRAERICWELLRDRRLGAKFRRQHPIGSFFADFACLERRLVVEIDGEQHAFQVEADARRTAAMERDGWRVLRFWATEVMAGREGIAAEIARALSVPLTQPLPPKGGEEPDIRGNSPLCTSPPRGGEDG
ncbi:Very-short-patch-repair endonuclease [Enhydrobacter aerosaccus]|uniref:Very-short-patch-repair endonuclease n=1 Tax=Enhydrobacter aerosaccus TaxID=225324 RepID=A0A1T4SFZ7_9HYPH|nr:DUF559 domain-containing protein [Enhydrobacter aerosaccus]SKA27224.1 Very-short-patch-repair endonuclease [Enhydrobacter aerosaccus]